MRSGLWPRKSAIAFDAGASGVRVVQFRRPCGGRLHAESLAVDAAPSADASRAAKPDGREPTSVDAPLLAHLIEQGDFDGRAVELIAGPPDVSFLPLRVAEATLAQPADVVEQALRWEVAQQSRLAAEDVEVRYWRLPPQAPSQWNIMAVAMPTARIVEWWERLREVGLSLERVEVAPCALARAAQVGWSPAADELWGVLDLGQRHSTLALVIGQAPVYVRALTPCASTATRRIASELQIGEREAARVMHGDAAPLGACDSGGALSQLLHNAIAPTVRQLCKEVERCFAYIADSLAAAPRTARATVRGAAKLPTPPGESEPAAPRLFVAGGGACLPGLHDALLHELGFACCVLGADPTSERAADWGVRLEPRAAAVLGGALLNLEGACTRA